MRKERVHSHSRGICEELVKFRDDFALGFWGFGVGRRWIGDAWTDQAGLSGASCLDVVDL